jgi:oligopeptide/dipeptide ABC transporter ATP-binding protein
VSALLEVRDLHTEFTTRDGVVPAVRGVSWDVGIGESVALVGESGCGKSVSALSVMGLVAGPAGRVTRGSVRFKGRDLLTLPEPEMRGIRGREIAMIFQEARALELLGLVGIADAERRLGQFPHQLSGGMRQRVMIAMALACQPALVLADEPTTALDVTVQAQILDLLRDLSRRLEVALLLISHDLGVVARYAERVYVMYAGRIVEEARARDLYGAPRHPYTIGLLGSVPRLDEPRRARLPAIAGQPPDLARLPAGCAFHPRCRWRVARCETEAPELEPVGTDHRAACWEAARLVDPGRT